MTSGTRTPITEADTRTRSPRSILALAPRALLFIILLLVVSVAQVAAETGPAHGKGRIAPDLRELAQKRSPYDTLRVVVNLNGAASEQTVDQIKRIGGEVKGAYRKTRQMVLEVPAGAVESLAAIEGLDYVAPDRPVSGLASHLDATTGASQVYKTSGPDWSFFVTGSLLSGYNGSGVTVAVLDSGVDPDMTDLRDSGHRRTVLSMNFATSGSIDDPYGHGTHVAGIIAGNGASSIKAGFDFTGVAPSASLVNYRVLDDKGRGYLSNVIAAINLAVTTSAYYNIRVINLSLAAPPVESFRDDPLCRAVDTAVQAGIVVVAAAGNFGLDANGNKVYGGITSPGICPSAITVGATSTRATDIRSDDVVARFSSRGPTRSRSIDPVTGAIVYDNLVKPDLVAPGVRIVSLERYANAIVTAHPDLDVYIGSNVNSTSHYMRLSGTSMATPVVSGAVALMLQANPSLNPRQVRAILMYSAQIMEGADLFEQGAGMVNIEGAVRAAASMSKVAGTTAAGGSLTIFGVPRPVTTIAGVPFAWNQSLIWGDAWLSGEALLGVQQTAYAQSLIWGFGDASAWGAGVTWNNGLFADDYVVFGKNGQWAYVTWGAGTTQSSGLVWRDELYASGVIWQSSLMTDAFYTLDPSSLIWGDTRYGYDLSLIWGIDDASLIWGFDEN